MSRKDYELIARTIRDEYETSLANYERFGPVAIAGVAKALARDLGNENPRFDALRFLRACGLSDEQIGEQS